MPVCRTNSSTFDKYVCIQELDESAVDAHGFTDNTDDDNWPDYARSYARVVSRGGREFWKVHQVTADVSHVWTVPWSKRLAKAQPKMRLIYDGDVFEILSVTDVDLAHREVEIQTRRSA